MSERVDVCVLDHFPIVTECHVQVVISDMFITQPASVLRVQGEIKRREVELDPQVSPVKRS